MIKELESSCWLGKAGTKMLGILGTLILTTSVGCTGSTLESDSESLPGQAVYGHNCAPCHGPEGDGQGPAAYLVFPKPRNFQRGDFKLRTTAMGQLPTDEDLVRTVTGGIPGSSMFSFAGVLSETEIEAVVEYVKLLTPKFADATPVTQDQLLQIPDPPASTPELVAAGRQVYELMRCAQCHGPEGRGDGPSAPTLRDSEGDPFPAADFTVGIYKGGRRPQDLYRTFLTGMAGTPMPSYASALQSDEQAWTLVYYVLSLAPGGEPPPTRSDPGPLSAASLAGTTALTDPWSPDWDNVAPHGVALRPLWYRNDYPTSATLRAVRDGDQIALLVEWRDSSQNTEALRTQSFSDAVALQFALVDPPPFVGMGQAGPGGEVEIWYWRADRQAASAQGHPAELTSVYPNLDVDRYPFAVGDDPLDDNLRAADELPRDQEPPYVAARDVGNPVSDPDLMTQPVHGLAAAGYGSLTSRTADQMRAAGNGSWRDGVYRVLFTAPAAPTTPEIEADFTLASVPLAVAIWDGAAGDRNGTKLVSQWLMLEPEPRRQNR